MKPELLPIQIQTVSLNEFPRGNNGKCDCWGKENSMSMCVVIGRARIEEGMQEAWLDVWEGRDMNRIEFWCIPCRQRISRAIDNAIREIANGSCESA